jgi:hypothetical protein
VSLIKSIHQKAGVVRISLSEATPASDTALENLEPPGKPAPIHDVIIQDDSFSGEHLETVMQLVGGEWRTRMCVPASADSRHNGNLSLHTSRFQ